jgi:hypothetical protein
MAAVVDGSDPLLAKTQAALLQQALAARLAAEEAVRQPILRAAVSPPVLYTEATRVGGLRHRTVTDCFLLLLCLHPQLRDKRNELQLACSGRETAGVELYSVQQQLQRLAGQLHAAEEERFAVTRERNAAEQELSDLTQQHSELVQEAQSAQATVRWDGSALRRGPSFQALTAPDALPQHAHLPTGGAAAGGP